MGNNHKIRWSIFSCLIQAVKCKKFPSYPWSVHILVYNIYKLNMRHTLYIFCRVYAQFFLNYVGMCRSHTNYSKSNSIVPAKRMSKILRCN